MRDQGCLGRAWSRKEGTEKSPLASASASSSFSDACSLFSPRDSTLCSPTPPHHYFLLSLPHSTPPSRLTSQPWTESPTLQLGSAGVRPLTPTWGPQTHSLQNSLGRVWRWARGGGWQRPMLAQRQKRLKTFPVQACLGVPSLGTREQWGTSLCPSAASREQLWPGFLLLPQEVSVGMETTKPHSHHGSRP